MFIFSQSSIDWRYQCSFTVATKMPQNVKHFSWLAEEGHEAAPVAVAREAVQCTDTPDNDNSVYTSCEQEKSFDENKSQLVGAKKIWLLEHNYIHKLRCVSNSELYSAKWHQMYYHVSCIHLCQYTCLSCYSLWYWFVYWYGLCVIVIVSIIRICNHSSF